MEIERTMWSADDQSYKWLKFQLESIPFRFIHFIANGLDLAGYFGGEIAVYKHTGHRHPYAANTYKKLSIHFRNSLQWKTK